MQLSIRQHVLLTVSPFLPLTPLYSEYRVRGYLARVDRINTFLCGFARWAPSVFPPRLALGFLHIRTLTKLLRAVDSVSLTSNLCHDVANQRWTSRCNVAQLSANTSWHTAALALIRSRWSRIPRAICMSKRLEPVTMQTACMVQSVRAVSTRSMDQYSTI